MTTCLSLRVKSLFHVSFLKQMLWIRKLVVKTTYDSSTAALRPLMSRIESVSKNLLANKYCRSPKDFLCSDKMTVNRNTNMSEITNFLKTKSIRKPFPYFSELFVQQQHKLNTSCITKHHRLTSGRNVKSCTQGTVCVDLVNHHGWLCHEATRFMKLKLTILKEHRDNENLSFLIAFYVNAIWMAFNCWCTCKVEQSTLSIYLYLCMYVCSDLQSL